MSDQSEVWINGGYFIFRNKIFDYIREGEELVLEPFNRLIEEGRLMALQIRWILAGDGYAQGQAGARGNGGARRDAVACLPAHLPSRQGGIMKALQFATAGERLSVLCLGAHSDDIEIGVGATLLSLIERGVSLDVHWCVLSGAGEREREARGSAADFLKGAAKTQVEIMSFRDGFFPEHGEAIKSWFEALKSRVNPDVIFTHYRDDAHQDHRQVCSPHVEYVPRPLHS